MNPLVNTDFLRSLLPTSTMLDMGRFGKKGEKMESTTTKILRVKEDASSFIKQLEVTQREDRILQMIVIFNIPNPNDIENEPSNRNKSDLFQIHKANYYRLLFKDPLSIKSVLNFVEQTHEFTGNAKFEAREIRTKLFANSAKL